MFKRYRWYRVQLPKNSAAFNEAVAQNTFTPDTDFGFSRLEDESGSGSSTFRFLWRSKITVAKYNQEGLLDFENVTTVHFTDFTIFGIDENIFLRIENPTRSLSDFFNTLERIYGLGFTNKRITFEKSKPHTVFSAVDLAMLTKLKVVGVTFDNGLVGKMEFESKTGIEESQLQLLHGIPYKIESASYELLISGVRGHLTFSANGSVKVGGNLAPRILHLIEKDMLTYI
ncbi:hypothetical protein [uncultured Oxalicibacterium sp.]|uniref:hypothetical protein n=1 Tax=uncultured Oxalicibacterium sp. TaxID=1168540 RepID=UPI0025E8AA06|nr:hypothetical protein [uncultured Oxalicibacterium sp.]